MSATWNCPIRPSSRSGRKAEALGAVVFIHPSGFTEPRRFGRFYFSNVIGNPLDTTMALHHLIFDGVLERYPDLKIIAVAWRRVSAGVFRADRSCLGRAQRCARRLAEAAKLSI